MSLSVNGNKVTTFPEHGATPEGTYFAQFPDGTLRGHFDTTSLNMFESKEFKKAVRIEWLFEQPIEELILAELVYHIRKIAPHKPLNLYMPYIPNARMDRVKDPRREIFTLKSFCNRINAMKFNHVFVLDPHSSVVEALLDNVMISRTNIVSIKTLLGIEQNQIPKLDDIELVFYPDEGAMKRYSPEIEFPFAFGIKDRDWATGKINGLHIHSDGSIVGKNVLIVDDICSYGGTFYHSARALKSVGANSVYLYVTHCENSILKGQALEELTHVFTEATIFTEQHPKITTMIHQGGLYRM